MSDKKIFTYVSPSTDEQVAQSMCNHLPIIVDTVTTIEEVFTKLSNPCYYTDFICISIELFYKRQDHLDIFDIIHTMSTLIKSVGQSPDVVAGIFKRDTKIMVMVNERTEVKLIKEVTNYPDIISVGWVISNDTDYPSSIEHLSRVIAGDYGYNAKVSEMLKPKKKLVDNNIGIKLTPRQSQILHLVQDRGASNKTIAKMLKLSESTVKLHIGAIFKKYGVKNRTQLAVLSREKIS